MSGLKEATYEINGTTVKVAVISGLLNARKVIKKIKSNECDYNFIEVMSCPGGCINGGGQPFVSDVTRLQTDYRLERIKYLYEIDAQDSKRRAHENETIREMYDDYFGYPGSERAEKLLHIEHIIDKKN